MTPERARGLAFVEGANGYWEVLRGRLSERVRVGWFWLQVEPTGGNHTLVTLDTQVETNTTRLGHWPDRGMAKREGLRLLRDRLSQSIREIDRLLEETREPVVGLQAGTGIQKPD